MARSSSSSGPSAAVERSANASCGRSGQLLGLRGLQRAPCSPSGVERQRGGALEERRGRGHVRRAPAPARPSAPARRRRPRRVRRAAWARCQARRSGSASASVAAASARCAARRSSAAPRDRSPNAGAGGGRRPARRARACPPPTAGPTASIVIPSSAADRHSSAGSPVGSAAARSRSRWVAAGSCSTRRWKLASIRLCSGSSLGRPKPPARLAGDKSRGSSSRASGLPRASARIRPRTRSSSGAPMTEASSLRAAASDSPSSRRSGSRANSSGSAGSRTANSSTTDSACSRRATKASTCAEDRSSHWASSTRHSSGEFLGGLGQQAEHREADQEAVGLRRPSSTRTRSRARRAAAAAAARGRPAAARTADAGPRTEAPSPTPPRPRGRRRKPSARSAA